MLFWKWICLKATPLFEKPGRGQSEEQGFLKLKQFISTPFIFVQNLPLPDRRLGFTHIFQRMYFYC